MSTYLDYAGLSYYKAKSDLLYATKTELANESALLRTMVGAPSVAATATAMTDTSLIYVYTGSESGYTNGNWYYYDGSVWTSGGVYNAVAVQTDTTLTVSGVAADASAVGDALGDIGLSSEVKEALLSCFQHVAWIDEDGRDYYDALYEALYDTKWQITQNLTNCTTSNAATEVLKGGSFSATISPAVGYVMEGATVSITMGGTDVTATAYSNGTITIPAVTGALVITISAAPKTISSLAAVYTQSGTVYDTDSLDSLKADLVVTATYTDSSTATIPAADYTLSGTLTEGTSTITVSYGGKTDDFTVTVTHYSRLPSEYQEVEYIALKDGGNTYIETSFVPRTGSGMEYKGTRPNHFVQTSSTSNRFGIQVATFDNGNKNVRFVYRTTTYPAPTAAVPEYGGDTDIIEASLINYSYSVKDITQGTEFTGTTTTSSFTCPGEFCIFGVRTGDTINVYGNADTVLYYMRLYQGTVLVHDFVPCYRISDSEIGVYDLVNSEFLAGHDAGCFVAGPDV